MRRFFRHLITLFHRAIRNNFINFVNAIIESPIGKALKGHRVGDRVLVNVNENVSYYLRVKSIDKTGGEGENIRSF